MSTSSLRRHFDTLQSTGNGSSLVELQRSPDAIPLLLALLQEELAPEPPPVAVPAVLLLGRTYSHIGVTLESHWSHI